MNIANAKQQIKDSVEAYLKKDDAGMYCISPSKQRPIFLVGAPGIGKTAIMEQIAQELEIGIVSYSMTHHTRQSALGLPHIEKREYEGEEYIASEYSMSEIIASIYDYMKRTGEKKGILFLDEINCVSETLHPAMLQFLQFKTFGRHCVPQDWIIVCAGNPPEYNKSVHEFDIVTLDRLREIDIEPEYAAFKIYASEKGLHPAITTFLEAKQDCFYKVESKPGGGKSFVTARGWEDLAEALSLYERMNKQVDRDLFAQFLRDDDIADSFSTYYALFDKYRSDYKIAAILSGDVEDEVKTRAQKAVFDEHVALIGLILDSLASSCALTLEKEAVVLALRDELRAAKEVLLEGGTVSQTIDETLSEREACLSRKIRANTIKQEDIRKERLIIKLLHELSTLCNTKDTTSGKAAFETLQTAYKQEVDTLKPLADETGEKLNNAFDFIEECFGNGREMLVFMAELSTRAATTSFIAHYGCEKYYAHNDELQVDSTRSSLESRIANLQELDMEVKSNARDAQKPSSDAVTDDAGGVDAANGELNSANDEAVDGAGAKNAGAKNTTDKNAGARNGAVENAAAKNAGSSVLAQKDWTAQELADFYKSRAFDWGFASICKMTLTPSLLKGKVVLDIGCRRGRGVYKLSAQVGEKGKAIGIDWASSFIEEAKAGAERAYRESGLPANNMEFHLAYPEDLISAGIGTKTIDAIYINNVITLIANPYQALCEFARVLKDDGLFICETVYSDKLRDESVAAAAKEIGNSIQAAHSQVEFEKLLYECGFSTPEVVERYEVSPERGVTQDKKVEVIPSDEDVKFSAVALNIRKRV